MTLLRNVDPGTDFDGVQPYELPDGYMWTDTTQRGWTNRGTGNILNLTPLPGRVFVYEQVNVWR